MANREEYRRSVWMELRLTIERRILWHRRLRLEWHCGMFQSTTWTYWWFDVSSIWDRPRGVPPSVLLQSGIERIMRYRKFHFTAALQKLTLIISSTAMHVIPSTVSHTRMLWMSLKIDCQISRNVVPLAEIPKTSLICDVTIISDTAEVNPEDTGPDTKSTRKPNPKIPISSSMIPARKDNRTALCTFPRAVWYVSRADMADGPIGTSLQLPRKMYTIHPTKEPYRPYCKEKTENRIIIRPKKMLSFVRLNQWLGQN